MTQQKLNLTGEPKKEDEVDTLKQRILTGFDKINERLKLIDTMPDNSIKQAYIDGVYKAHKKLNDLCFKLIHKHHYEGCLYTERRCEQEEEMEQPCLVCPFNYSGRLEKAKRKGEFMEGGLKYV
jgi:hypothetical protein